MEGAPDRPHDRLWTLIEEERVTVLGCSPTLIRALLQHGDPKSDLSSLRTIVTTGEPWNPEPYRWLFEHVGGGRLPIINYTGGTEMGACFPRHARARSSPARSRARPGMAAESSTRTGSRCAARSASW